MLKTRVRTITVHTKRTFAIARSSDDAFGRVVFEIEEDGFVGRGEAAPSERYGLSLIHISAPTRPY